MTKIPVDVFHMFKSHIRDLENKRIDLINEINKRNNDLIYFKAQLEIISDETSKIEDILSKLKSLFPDTTEQST